MRDVRTFVPNSELCASVQRLVSRLGPINVVSSDRWRSLADQCVVDATTTSFDSTIERSALLIGPPAFVLKHAATARSNFGFVIPVAQTSRRWQRAIDWRDDATLDLWDLGWTPRALDRVLVPNGASVIEFAVGDVRRTPRVTNTDTGGT